MFPAPSLFHPKWDSKEKNRASSLQYNTRFSPSTERLVQKWFQLEHNKYISHTSTQNKWGHHILFMSYQEISLFSPLLFLFFFFKYCSTWQFLLNYLFWVGTSDLTSAGSMDIWRKWEWTSACWQPVKRVLQIHDSGEPLGKKKGRKQSKRKDKTKKK